MSVRVVNKQPWGRAAEPDESVVTICRPSIFGNPYPLINKNDYAARTRVIARYEKWLRAEWLKGGSVKTALQQLVTRSIQGEKLALSCHCAPLPCHGDVLKRAIDRLVDKHTKS